MGEALEGRRSEGNEIDETERGVTTAGGGGYEMTLQEKEERQARSLGADSCASVTPWIGSEGV